MAKTISEIEALSSDPLSELEIERAALIMYADTDTVGIAATQLTVSKRKLVREQLEVYAETPDELLAVKGGKDAKYWAQEHDRLNIAAQLRRLFGLDPIPADQLELIASRVNAEKGHGAQAPFTKTGSGATSGSVGTVTVWS